MSAADTTPAPDVFAIVEQMGHRRFGARIREVTRFGAPCMEATVLTTPEVTTYVFPASLFAVTVCTEEQARKANQYGTGLPALEAGDSRDDDIPFGDDAVACLDCGARLVGDCAADCPSRSA